MMSIIKREAFNAAASDFWLQQASQAIEQRGRFDVALSGGQTPKAVFNELRDDPEMGHNWPGVHLWFGDERCVSPDHPDSNYRMAEQALIQHVPVASVHRMRGELPPQEAAALYAQELEVLAANAQWPVFDLVMLGLGRDGHVASLFPGSNNVLEKEKSVSAAYVESVESWRLSITLPVIRQARTIMVLAVGEDKAEVVSAVIDQQKGDLPATLIAQLPQTYWFLDDGAASRLKATPSH